MYHKVTVLRTWIILCVLEIFANHTKGVKINKLEVPEVTKLGNPIVLDCDYSWDEIKDDGLVVKWFFNRKTQIYQWIINNKPQAIGIFRERLNLEYAASQHNSSRHRALHITKPGPELSGDYTCSVSSINDEDTRTKSMLVFVPETSLKMRQEASGNRLMRVSCFAEGVFPQPEIILFQEESMINDTVINVEKSKGLYNVKAISDLISIESAKKFTCELHIPKANYTRKKVAVYYPINKGNIICKPSPIVMTTILWFVLEMFYGSTY